MLEYDAIYTGKYFLDPKLEGTNLLWNISSLFTKVL
jgi:hypothetical protein